jgi:hypothetical protein
VVVTMPMADQQAIGAIAWPLRLVLRQNVNLAKLPLDLLYTFGAERVRMTVPPARYRAPAILTWYDRNGNCR